MLLKPVVIFARPVADVMDDMVLDLVSVAATAEFRGYSMIVEILRAQAGCAGVEVAGLSQIERWGLGTRNGHPYVARVRVVDIHDRSVARCHLAWQGAGSEMQLEAIYVSPEYRRKGVASAMLRLASRVLGVCILPPATQTNDGMALWTGLHGSMQVPVAA